ncbi:major allergen I polypeptide chain 2-like [Sciurus carolinensis]|uniref:major allergen I polypeptide chain 2-like n=1 Tax=Sciurus carolinensis TaxID=30640 RepID=UPI001FB37F45|nr:major allergen I polypeptide chain 2-like [Sciurus carolinensis]
MKGILLVLALLVTRELGFQTAEACPLFYGIFAAIPTGSKTLLDAALDVANFTEPEKAAVEKIQDCYNENGLKAKALDAIAMFSITVSPSCILSYLKSVEEKL